MATATFLSGTPTTLQVATSLVKHPTPRQDGIDGIGDIDGIDGIDPLSPSGIAEASALATSLGFHQSNSHGKTSWTAIPIAIGVVVGLCVLGVLISTATRAWVNKMTKGTDNDNEDDGINNDGHPQPPASANAGASHTPTSHPSDSTTLPLPALTPKERAGCLRSIGRALVSLLGGRKFGHGKVHVAAVASDEEQARSASWRRQLALDPEHDAPLSHSEPYPLEQYYRHEHFIMDDFNVSAAPTSSPSQAAKPPTIPKPVVLLGRANSLKRLSYGIRRVADPIYHRGTSPSETVPVAAPIEEDDRPEEVSPTLPSLSMSSSSSSGSSSSSSSSSGSSAGPGDSDMCCFAASLPRMPSTAAGRFLSRHRRGRPVRSEGGRETQLKLQQSLSASNSSSVALSSTVLTSDSSLSSYCSEEHDEISSDDADEGDSMVMTEEIIPEMSPAMPQHRVADTPRSILKKPTNVAAAEAARELRADLKMLSAAFSADQSPSSASPPAPLSPRSTSPPTSDGSTLSRAGSLRDNVRSIVTGEGRRRSKAASSYVPRWAPGKDSMPTDGSGESAVDSDNEEEVTGLTDLKSKKQKAVHFGQDTVRRISILSTAIDAEEEDEEDEEEGWVTVEEEGTSETAQQRQASTASPNKAHVSVSIEKEMVNAVKLVERVDGKPDADEEEEEDVRRASQVSIQTVGIKGHEGKPAGLVARTVLVSAH